MFTKLLRPVVRYWRANGLRIVVYLDNGIGLEQQHEAAAASKFVQDTLHRCGLVANVTKSQWEPTSRLQWLGFDLNIAEGTIRVPEQKVSQLKVLLIELKQQKFAKARMIAKVTGKLISMWLGLGSTVRLMSRSLYKHVPLGQMYYAWMLIVWKRLNFGKRALTPIMGNHCGLAHQQLELYILMLVAQAMVGMWLIIVNI